MFKKILMTLSGVGFLFSGALEARDAQMFRQFRTERATIYNEYLSRGYDIQPNSPSVWDTGCRITDYYCMGDLERNRLYADIEILEPAISRHDRWDRRDHGGSRSSRR